MFRFDLKGVDIARKADVKRTQLSAFRTGKRDLYASTLQQIIKAMPPEAQAYYYELLKRSAVNPNAFQSLIGISEHVNAGGHSLN